MSVSNKPLHASCMGSRVGRIGPEQTTDAAVDTREEMADHLLNKSKYIQCISTCC